MAEVQKTGMRDEFGGWHEVERLQGEVEKCMQDADSMKKKVSEMLSLACGHKRLADDMKRVVSFHE